MTHQTRSVLRRLGSKSIQVELQIRIGTDEWETYLASVAECETLRHRELLLSLSRKDLQGVVVEAEGALVEIEARKTTRAVEASDADAAIDEITRKKE